MKCSAAGLGLSVLLVFGSVLPGLPAQGQKPGLEEDVFVLSGESIPLNLRLSIFVASLVTGADEKPESVRLRLQELGLNLDRQEIQALVEFYGDFDEGQRRRLEREAGAVSERRAALGPVLDLERAEFEGKVLGEWLDFLRQRGHDVETFLRRFRDSSNTGYSMSFSGEIPVYEELQERSRWFGAAFEQQYGASLRNVVEIE